MAGIGMAIIEGLAAGAAEAGVSHMLNGHDNHHTDTFGPSHGPSYIPPMPDFPSHHQHDGFSGPLVIDQNTVFDMPAHDGMGAMSTTPGLYGGIPSMGNW